MTQPLTGEARTLGQLAEQEETSRRATFKVFLESERLMMVISSLKTVGEAVVCVPASGQSWNPNVTVSMHPRHHVAVQELIELLSPNHGARRTINGQTMKMRVSNPRYVTNKSLREVQSDRVAAVARQVAQLTGKPVEVRFHESDGHNVLYINGDVVPGS